MACQDSKVKNRKEAYPFPDSKKRDTISADFINQFNLKSDNKSVPDSPYTLLCNFDANCSACIMQFINFLENINKGKAGTSVRYVFIAYASDLSLIHYYMKEFNIILRSNQLMITDNDKSFERLHSFIEKHAMNIILTNRNYEVITSGNPFTESKVSEIYRNLRILF
jgi:hypothetical protein